MRRLQLFPHSTTIQNGKLMIGQCDLDELAQKHGTPLYIYDRAELDLAASRYRTALAESWPAKWFVTYAGKAFLCPWMARWAKEQGFTVDCTGVGEISTAAEAELPREQILVHGVNKSLEDLQAAIQCAGTIVVDNLSELRRLVSLRDTGDELPRLWLRFRPGLAVDTHRYRQTGHTESKFGMNLEQMREALAFCQYNNLPICGIHFHQGSQFRDAAPLEPAIESGLDLAKEIGFGDEWHFCPGGGWGVAYHEDELPNPSIKEYARFVAETTLRGCQKRGLNLPRLHLEPGRSLVAKAGVAIYRIGTVKQAGERTWLLVDGGMADNPRHALYGARYSALTVKKPEESPTTHVWVAGPFCESGDVLIENLPLPQVEEGALIAIPVSGAYHLSMASNYNGARRPAAVVVENGKAQTILRRETTADLLSRGK